ncbi:hypothetical protein [Changchengzhania lutea]|uniref:hypothetical protein n=1 Tax=Changchengzhania lutea TaxID=2049305 RepID=UPI00115EA26A|nr:hypothetical protein [Changchengzhania lutea]
MSSRFKIVIPCDEANHVCDKTQYKESSFREKIILNLHLIYCRACRKYSKNNAKLTEVLNKSEVCCMDKDSKASIKQNLHEALENHSESN